DDPTCFVHRCGEPCGTGEMPAQARFFIPSFHALSPFGDAGKLAPPATREEWYERRGAPNRADGGDPVERGSRSAKGALNETTYRTWFAEAEGQELTDDAFVLGVPNDFTREWIEGHFLGLIGAAVRDVTGQERHVGLTVSERAPLETPPRTEPPRRPPQTGAHVAMSPKYTFDLFAIGASKPSAHSAALAVALPPPHG